MGNEYLQCAQQTMKIFPQRIIPTTAPWNMCNYPQQGDKAGDGVAEDVKFDYRMH